MISGTILHRLRDWALTSPEAPAQSYKSEKGIWKTLSAQEYYERTQSLAYYLESEGFGEKDIGAIFSYNCKEWPQTELAMGLIRMKCVGLYPNSVTKEVHYILNHTQASLIAVQNEEYFKKLVLEGYQIPACVRKIIVFEGKADFSPLAISFEEVLKRGRSLMSAKNINTYLERLDVHEPAFLIYTSGTTGNPKGAMLSHDNLVFASDLVIKRWQLPFQSGSLFSFLPMCHIAEQLHSVGVGISQRYLTYYCTKFDNVSTELLEAEPTLLLCVPRVWEKMMEKVQLTISHAPLMRKALATWAIWQGGDKMKSKFEDRSRGRIAQVADFLAAQLVLSKVRKKMGLGRATILASGAAPLPAHVSRWFRSIGLEILECYGMTETTAVISITLPGKDCAGTVGKPLDGCEFKFAPDGEIWTKGRHIFLGYYKDPENTAATLEDGWLKTGDLGEWTKEGYVKIRGRKREIMKTSGGKMIAPVPIEEQLKVAEFISQVCLVGDNRKYLSALITLAEGTLKQLNDKKAKIEKGLIIDQEILTKVKAEIARVNQSLSSYEQVKKFAVLDREFSIVEGEMTPTMKMKRSTIESRFKTVIDGFYAAEDV